MQDVRDFDADGDQAQFRFDGGLDLNGNPGVDIVTPGDVSYGFEEFTDTRTPGYIDDGNGNNVGTGTGTYVQNIDATQLTEGRHYVTARAFRHRDPGEPAVFSDFRKVIYVDRLPPEAEVVSFEPFATEPQDTENRDLIVRSVDKTADNMHFFLDLPANMPDDDILDMALAGQGDAGEYDRDSFISGIFGVETGNHVATVVTFEPTFNRAAGRGFSIQRFAGLFTETSIGAGFGDADFDGVLETSDIAGLTNGSIEQTLYSQNDEFSAALDVNGDGLGDNRDLYALGGELVDAAASGSVLAAYRDVLLRRGDVDESGMTAAADFDTLYDNFGSDAWLFDLNVDGTTDVADVMTMVTEFFGTVPGDLDLNGVVDPNDLAIWQAGLGTSSNARYSQGDADFDGDVDALDRDIIDANMGELTLRAIALADYNRDGVVARATTRFGGTRSAR